MRQPLDYIFPDPPAGLDPAKLAQSRIPRHVAVIMDGNGRWAKQRAMNRLSGHKAGINAVRETIRCANDVGVDYLTIYSFSTENWKRPQDEVNGLMNLFAKTMLAELDGLHEEGVRVATIGDTSALPEKTARAFSDAWEKTKNNTGMTLVIAVNYGSRAEILEAAQRSIDEALAAVAEGKTSEQVDPPADVRELAKYASPIVSCGNQTGEGWFLTGEMMELIHSDVYNIVCIQPFACLPNHIVGKGVIKAIRKEYPKANIVAVDYDPGASEVNQLNRIKLMLSTANKNLKQKLREEKDV